MPEWWKWLFDGLGTEIVSFIIGGATGGLAVFKIGKRNSKFTQSQKARDNSSQIQVGEQHNA
jgi:hypothetical protein